MVKEFAYMLTRGRVWTYVVLFYCVFFTVQSQQVSNQSNASNYTGGSRFVNDSQIEMLCGIAGSGLEIDSNSSSVSCLDCSGLKSAFLGVVFASSPVNNTNRVGYPVISHNVSGDVLVLTRRMFVPAVDTGSIVRNYGHVSGRFIVEGGVCDIVDTYTVARFGNLTDVDVLAILPINDTTLLALIDASQIRMLVKFNVTYVAGSSTADNICGSGGYVRQLVYNGIVSGPNTGDGLSLSGFDDIITMTSGVTGALSVNTQYYPGTPASDVLIFAVNTQQNVLITICLVTGNRRVVSSADYGGGPDFEHIARIKPQTNTGRIMVMDNGPSALLSIDITNSNRYVISSSDYDLYRGDGPDIPQNIAFMELVGVGDDEYVYLFTDDLAEPVTCIKPTDGTRTQVFVQMQSNETINYHTVLDTISYTDDIVMVLVRVYHQNPFNVTSSTVDSMSEIRVYSVRVTTGMAHRETSWEDVVSSTGDFSKATVMRTYTTNLCGSCTRYSGMCTNETIPSVSSSSSTSTSISASISRSASATTSVTASVSVSVSTSTSPVNPFSVLPSIQASPAYSPNASASTQPSQTGSPTFAPPDNTNTSTNINNTSGRNVTCRPGQKMDGCGVCGGYNTTCVVSCAYLNNCSGKGVCMYGNCFCNPSWSGPDCSRQSNTPRTRQFTQYSEDIVNATSEQSGSVSQRDNAGDSGECSDTSDCDNGGTISGMSCIESQCTCMLDSPDYVCYTELPGRGKHVSKNRKSTRYTNRRDVSKTNENVDILNTRPNQKTLYVKERLKNAKNSLLTEHDTSTNHESFRETLRDVAFQADREYIRNDTQSLSRYNPYRRMPIESEISPCVPRDCCGIDCSGNGWCSDSICRCGPGYTGVNCEYMSESAATCDINCADLDADLPPCLQAMCSGDSGQCIIMPKHVGVICQTEDQSSCVGVATCDGWGNCIPRTEKIGCTGYVYLLFTLVFVSVGFVLGLGMFAAYIKLAYRRHRHSA